MLADDQLIPNPSLLLALHQLEAQILDLLYAAGHSGRLGHRHCPVAAVGASFRGARREAGSSMLPASAKSRKALRQLLVCGRECASRNP